jgi:hypothetical protein
MFKTRYKDRIRTTISNLTHKYYFKHSSDRTIFSKLQTEPEPKDLSLPRPSKKSKKVAVPPYKFPTLVHTSESPKSPHQFPGKSRSRKVIPNFSQKSIFQSPNPKEDSPINGNRLDTLKRLSGSSIMKSYEKLIRSCSQITQTKNVKFKKEEKKVKRIARNIKNITDDPGETNQR